MTDTFALTGQSRVNQLQVFAGTDTAYGLAKQHKIKTAFGSDLLFSSQLASRQGLMLTHLTRWYDAAEILTMATSDQRRTAWPVGPAQSLSGQAGVIEEGRMPICWSSTATRFKTSRFSPRRDIAEAHHERRRDSQGCT